MTFMESGRGWTVTGMSPRSEKYPINVKRDDGKGFRMPAQKVALALKLDLSPYVQRVKVSDHLLGGKKA
jgi:hypothetical protein